MRRGRPKKNKGSAKWVEQADGKFLPGNHKARRLYQKMLMKKKKQAAKAAKLTTKPAVKFVEPPKEAPND